MLLESDGINCVIFKRGNKETYAILYDDSIEQAHQAIAITAGWAEDRRLRFNWKDKIDMSKEISSNYRSACQARDRDCKGR